MTDSAPSSDRSRFYSVTELAQEFSLTSQGIRFYEESGLIAPARVGRTRVFNYQDRARLILIQRLRRLGFSIDAIREYLSLYKADATGAAQYGADSIASPSVSASSRASGTTSTRRWRACARSRPTLRSASIAR
jgi:DNA-binding transcriptional MerR regulator